MRKAVVLLLLSALLLTALPVGPAAAREDAVGAYEVTAVAGAQMYAAPQAVPDIVMQAPRGAVLNVLRTQDGFGYTVYDSVYGWVLLDGGLQYRDAAPGLRGETVEGAAALKIVTMPDQTVFTDGDEPDTEGLSVALVFDDPQQTELPVDGYTVLFPSLYQPGNAQVRVCYAGLETAYPIQILGALGLASMWLAVFGDVGVSVIAILNSMRTLRK